MELGIVEVGLCSSLDGLRNLVMSGCLEWLNLVVVLNRRIVSIVGVELLGLEAVVIDDLVFLVALNFVSAAVKIVALKVYLITQGMILPFSFLNL